MNEIRQKKILIVEDSQEYQEIYSLALKNYKLVKVNSFEEMMSVINGEHFDLIILDIMLPGQDGFAACMEIKKGHLLQAQVPIIFVSGKEGVDDRINAFNLGADDYLVKPFDVRELVARVQARLKADVLASSDFFECDFFKISVPEKKAWLKNANYWQSMELTQVEFDLAVYLFKNKGLTIGRDQILQDIWGSATFVTERTVDTHISKLRKKLKEYENAISTIRGFGYRFDHLFSKDLAG